MDRYFIPQAERVSNCAAVSDGETYAKVPALIRTQTWTERFTGWTVHRVARGQLADICIRKATLDMLGESGLLDEDLQREGKTAGRNKEWYRVNGRIFHIGSVIPDLDTPGV